MLHMVSDGTSPLPTEVLWPIREENIVMRRRTDGLANSWRMALLSILAVVVPGPLDAQEPLTLESMNRNVNTASAEFSPTAPEMAVLTNRSGRSKIWLMGTDGSNPRMLIGDDYREASPVWSPDGRSIAEASPSSGPWRAHRTSGP